MKAPCTHLSSTFHPFYITPTTSSTAAQLQLSATAGLLIAGIQTQEQLDNLLNSFFFHGIQCVIFCLIGDSEGRDDEFFIRSPHKLTKSAKRQFMTHLPWIQKVCPNHRGWLWGQWKDALKVEVLVYHHWSIREGRPALRTKGVVGQEPTVWPDVGGGVLPKAEIFFWTYIIPDAWC